MSDGTNTRIALDTNLWSYLGDQGAAEEFQRLVDGRGFRVVIPPSTLLEVLRLPLAEPRKRIIDVMTHARRVRLTSEAELESRETVAEVKRCRPQWLRFMPDTAKVVSLHAYWTKRVWREAKEHPEALHVYLVNQSPIAEHLLGVQRKNRAGVLRDKFDAADLSHLQVTATAELADAQVAGWDGGPVEAWRWITRKFFWHQLRVVHRRAVSTGEDTTMSDWIGAYVALDRMTGSPEDFTKFWFYDVERCAVPRNWLRWAVHQVQTSMKVTAGNPYDDQHSAYLVDFDVFLSADKRYIQALEIVKNHAGFSMAEPRLVSSGLNTPIVDRLSAALE